MTKFNQSLFDADARITMPAARQKARQITLDDLLRVNAGFIGEDDTKEVAKLTADIHNFLLINK